MKPATGLERLRQIASGSLIGLILLSLAWELWLAPLRPGGSWLVVKVLPLLMLLPGVHRGHRYTFRWSSLVVWIYFTEGCVRAWTDPPPGRWLALLEIALSLAFFVSAAWYARNAHTR